MNVLIATSRGKGIAGRLPKGVIDHAEVCSGAKLKSLSAKIPAIVNPLSKIGLPTFVYVLGGSNDITEKITSTNPHYWYTEVIFVKEKDSVVSDVKKSIDECARTIKKAGGIPVFCTITDCNLQHYNDYCLGQGYTHITPF